MAKKTTKKKDIINLEDQRMGLFMSENSFNLDIMYGRNYLQSDNAQYVVLHRINITQTQVHDLYGQAKAKDKKFMSPVRLSVMTGIEDANQEFYGGVEGGISRDDTGNLRN